MTCLVGTEFKTIRDKIATLQDVIRSYMVCLERDWYATQVSINLPVDITDSIIGNILFNHTVAANGIISNKSSRFRVDMVPRLVKWKII